MCVLDHSQVIQSIILQWFCERIYFPGFPLYLLKHFLRFLGKQKGADLRNLFLLIEILSSLLCHAQRYHALHVPLKNRIVFQRAEKFLLSFVVIKHRRQTCLFSLFQLLHAEFFPAQAEAVLPVFCQFYFILYEHSTFI